MDHGLRNRWVIALVWLGSACGEPDPLGDPDGGRIDAGRIDAGRDRVDAGAHDGALSRDDASPIDAALLDGGASDECVRPSEANTGVPPTAVLTPSSGRTITEAGAVLEDLEIDGSVSIRAAGVTIRRCRITGTIDIGEGVTGTVVEDSELIAPPGASSAGPGIGNHDFTMRRTRMSGFVVYARALAGTVILERNLMHAPCPTRPSDLVTGVAGYVPGPGSLRLWCNVIDMNEIRPDAECPGEIDHTVQLNSQRDASSAMAVVMDENWLDGGGYSVNFEHVFESLVIVNNRWGRSAGYGPILIDHLELTPPNELVWENNAFADTGEVIDLF